MSSGANQALENARSKLSDALSGLGEELEDLPRKISPFLEAADDSIECDNAGIALRATLRRAEILVAEIMASQKTLNNARGR